MEFCSICAIFAPAEFDRFLAIPLKSLSMRGKECLPAHAYHTGAWALVCGIRAWV